jgi:hypothetical protein
LLGRQRQEDPKFGASLGKGSGENPVLENKIEMKELGGGIA